MVDFGDIGEDRPEALPDESARDFQPFSFREDQRGFGLAFGLALFLLPVGLMVGVMRWEHCSHARCRFEVDIDEILRHGAAVLHRFAALPVVARRLGRQTVSTSFQRIMAAAHGRQVDRNFGLYHHVPGGFRLYLLDALEVGQRINDKQDSIVVSCNGPHSEPYKLTTNRLTTGH